MSKLGNKRLEAIWSLAGYAIGGGTVTAIPTPNVEVPKQVVLMASDILVYATIWKLYFEEDLSRQDLLEMLAELGVVTIAATGTAYVTARLTTAILCEIYNEIGTVGWGISAAIAGSLTGLCGLGWILYCDRLYIQRHDERETIEESSG